MTTLYQPRRRGEFLIEDLDTISFDSGILLSGQNLQAGTVLGQQTATAVATAAGTNTGNGTISAVTLGAQAQPGVYVVKITRAATNAGDFEVTDPMGDLIGVGNVGTPYNNGGLAFTVNDGATDFVLNDTFNITVTGSGKYRQLNPTATDGSQRAAAIIYDNVDASAGDVVCALVTRLQQVRASDLIWPAGITTPQRTAALAQLAALSIIAR